eukprot:SAG31_NODE_6425_length_2025_cov_0.957425_3_plen_111_part_00
MVTAADTGSRRRARHGERLGLLPVGGCSPQRIVLPCAAPNRIEMRGVRSAETSWGGRYAPNWSPKHSAPALVLDRPAFWRQTRACALHVLSAEHAAVDVGAGGSLPLGRA